MCRSFSYLEHFLVFVSAVSGRFSISAFASLVSVPVIIVCSTVGIKICAATAGTKKYKSAVKEKKKKVWQNSVTTKNYIRCNQSFDFCSLNRFIY